MNIHTDQKRTSTNLTKRSHTHPYKAYACPVEHCGKVFNVRSNMRRHLLTHKDYHQMDEEEYRPVSSRTVKF